MVTISWLCRMTTLSNFGCILSGQPCIHRRAMNRRLCQRIFLSTDDGFRLFPTIGHWKFGHQNWSANPVFCPLLVVILLNDWKETFIDDRVREGTDARHARRDFEFQSLLSDYIMSSQFANLQEYIAGLPVQVTQNIYGHPASCLAIFRSVERRARRIRCVRSP